MSINLMTIVDKQGTNGMDNCVLHPIGCTIQAIRRYEDSNILICLSGLFHLQSHECITLFIT